MLSRGIRLGLDRLLSVGYGVLYDYIYERFQPYRVLQGEVCALVEAVVPETAQRREIRVLDIGCGPGSFTCALAAAGFTVTGLDAYRALVEVAREKRRTKQLAHVSFRQADLADGNTFREGHFDQVVSIHSLYAHHAPSRLLREAHRVLKPGGHAVFVNHAQRAGCWATVRDIVRAEGWSAALRAMLWVLPNVVFEAVRSRTGPHYWDEAAFGVHLRAAGFTVLELRRTFLGGASVLAWVRKAGAT